MSSGFYTNTKHPPNSETPLLPIHIRQHIANIAINSSALVHAERIGVTSSATLAPWNGQNWWNENILSYVLISAKHDKLRPCNIVLQNENVT